jgi:predicted RNA binding protein YcfA (HicA-like mRNA interferase family)
MKSRDVIRALEADGWVLDRVKGSHHRYKHPESRGWSPFPIRNAS